MDAQVWTLIGAAAVMLIVIGGLAFFSQNYTLDNIKSRTVGDGQHGTARWASKKEIQQTFRHIPFHPKQWRKGEDLPKAQGLVLGSAGRKNDLIALVDTDDIHCLMIGASGVGKTAFFLYPNMEYACASGMSFLALDTKGDLARNYGAVASEHYGYRVAVIDLRNPTRSDGYNLLTLINRYMDICREQPNNLAARAKAEKYAKILAKTIVNPDGDASNYGQNAFFYDAAEGLLTAVILLLAEYLPPTEEDPSKNFMAGLMIQTLSRELFSVADENGGRLKNRVVLFCDELGTMPAFDILPLFSAGRSRRLTLVPIIQSLAQLEKNYGKEGAEIIGDNCQDTIFGGFVPNSQTAEVLTKALGSQTILSGSVNRSKGENSQTLQMMERPLMTPDELKSIPKGHFVVMKTGTHPMKTRLRLFLDWGITFGDPYLLPEKAAREVAYARRQELEQAIFRRHHAQIAAEEPPIPNPAAMSGGMAQTQSKRIRREQHTVPANLRTE